MNKKQRGTGTNRTISDWRFASWILMAGLIFLAACSPSQATKQAAGSPTSPSTAVAENTATPEATPTATATATPEPSLTPTSLPPTATPPPPTATAVPPLAIEGSGLQILCLRNDYQLPIHSADVFFSAGLAVQKSLPGSAGFEVSIPVRACGVFATFNQAVDDEVYVEVYEGSDSAPWYRRPFASVTGQPNTDFAVLDHAYIADPPAYGETYTLKIRGKTQTYWEGKLQLKRAFSGLCWEGSVPDPITLACPKVDRMEREPHADMPTFVPGGLR